MAWNRIGRSFGAVQNENDELDHSASDQCCSLLVQIEKVDDILAPLPRILEDVFRMKVKKEEERNPQKPEKAIEIRRDSTTVYYHSTVINGGDCNCPITFGGEVWKEAQEQSVRAANATVEGLALLPP